MKKVPLKRKTPLKRSGFKKKEYHHTWGSAIRSALSQLNAKPRKRIRQRSKKRVKLDAEYSKLRKEFLAENPNCLMCVERRCMHKFNSGVGSPVVNPSTQVHHKAGRYKFYLRVDTWLAVCGSCHQQITDDRRWAEEMGYSLTVQQRRLLD